MTEKRRENVIVHQGHPISGNPGTVSVQQCRRCACQSSAEVSDQEACSLYIRYADQADDKADVVLLNAYVNWPTEQRIYRKKRNLSASSPPPVHHPPWHRGRICFMHHRRACILFS